MTNGKKRNVRTIAWTKLFNPKFVMITATKRYAQTTAQTRIENQRFAMIIVKVMFALTCVPIFVTLKRSRTSFALTTVPTVTQRTSAHPIFVKKSLMKIRIIAPNHANHAAPKIVNRNVFQSVKMSVKTTKKSLNKFALTTVSRVTFVKRSAKTILTSAHPIFVKKSLIKIRTIAPNHANHAAPKIVKLLSTKIQTYVIKLARTLVSYNGALFYFFHTPQESYICILYR